MPAGLPYFAWVDASETTFQSEHLRWDESVFSFTLAQEEGNPANLTVVVRRPRNLASDAIGLLGPGRKIWIWFALDCGPALIKFRGRLVGVPTSLFEELVTLEFVAKPADLVAQKEALAETLRVLPYYDELLIDPSRRTDPDVVLEGYTSIWHYDRETHILTISDEISGEDGLVEFDGASETGKVLYDGLGLSLTSGPLSRVDISAEFTWTQQAQGTVDLTDYLISNWPTPDYAGNGVIASYTLAAADWPKNGAGLGSGWEVAEATAYDCFDNTVKTTTEGGTTQMEDGTTATYSSSISYIGSAPPVPAQGLILTNAIVIEDSWEAQYDDNGDATSLNRSYSAVGGTLPMLCIKPTLIAGYKAERPYTERVSLTLFADVQPILTDPEDGEALRIDNINSVNLSEDGIGDRRRRSYIATERGNRSIEYLIAFARAHLMKRARAVEITFVPKLARMPEITLRKNAFLVEPRVGEALGKIIGYSIALDGSDGRVNCEVRIGCAIGRGGSAVAEDGMPTYCSIDYTGYDYQQFSGRIVLFDSSVGYQPPNAAPNDDGIDFLSVLRPEDVIEVGLAVQNPALDQQEQLQLSTLHSSPTGVTSGQDLVAARAAYWKEKLKEMETRVTFKLKNMTRGFATDYELLVTDLNIPTGYDLEKV